MRPKRIILVRHGESRGNADQSLYETIPDYALCLTETGKKQARAAGEEIVKIIGSGTVRAYVSPWHRTRQTFAEIADVLGERLVKATEDPRLREQDWGHLQTPEALEAIRDQRHNYGTFYYRIPDGESAADVYDRVSTFLETLHRDFAHPDFPENILIVTHGVTLRTFLMRWFHWPVEFYENVYNPKNAEVVYAEQLNQGEYAGHYQLQSPLRLYDDGKAALDRMTLCLNLKVYDDFLMIAAFKGDIEGETRITFFREIFGTLQFQRLADFDIRGQSIGNAEEAHKVATEIWHRYKGEILSGKPAPEDMRW
ncbi:MAG: histidine phosphatase family protein [Desulfuromonadales bacterium]